MLSPIQESQMPLQVERVSLEEVAMWRDLHRKEMNCQIILDSWHGRGWVDAYLCRIDGHIVGYGLVGGVRSNPKDTITEFYLLPIYRGAALPLFRQLIAASNATTIETQTNDMLLTLMLFDCTENIERNAVLFDDGFTTHLRVNGAIFRAVTDADREALFAHNTEPAGDWGIEVDGAIVATGGILFHYNVPFGDIYMEVSEPYRRRGIGSLLVQELKRVCYEMGRVPAARCSPVNAASRATLQKAGMLPCARVLVGTLNEPRTQ